MLIMVPTLPRYLSPAVRWGQGVCPLARALILEHEPLKKKEIAMTGIISLDLNLTNSDYKIQNAQLISRPMTTNQLYFQKNI